MYVCLSYGKCKQNVKVMQIQLHLPVNLNFFNKCIRTVAAGSDEVRSVSGRSSDRWRDVIGQHEQCFERLKPNNYELSYIKVGLKW